MRKGIFVVGANSIIGNFLLPHLIEQGWKVYAVSRQVTNKNNPAIHWLEADIQQPQPEVMTHLEECFAVLHLAPLPLLLNYLPYIKQFNVPRLIAFSTTSIFTKQHALSAKDQQLVTEFSHAESSIRNYTSIDWTIFRPTMIYAPGHDKNLTLLAKFIKRYHFFPIVGQGNGLRQPVHAEDLATACLTILNNPATYHKSYNLSGGEVLSYREMIKRLFQAYHIRPHFLSIPKNGLRLVLKILSYFPRFKHFTPDMADRMNADHVFSHEDATKDFGYRPRNFEWDKR